MAHNYLLVYKKILPDYYEKVIEAREMLHLSGGLPDRAGRRGMEPAAAGDRKAAGLHAARGSGARAEIGRAHV